MVRRERSHAGVARWPAVLCRHCHRDSVSYVTLRGASCSLASGQLCEIPNWTGEARASKNLECILCTDFRAENSKARDRARRNCE